MAKATKRKAEVPQSPASKKLQLAQKTAEMETDAAEAKLLAAEAEEKLLDKQLALAKMQTENQLLQIQADKAARLAIPAVVPAAPAAVDGASGGGVVGGGGIAEGGSSFFQAMMDMQSTALAATEADREQRQAAKAQDKVDKQLAAHKSRSKVAAPDADELMANVQSQFDLVDDQTAAIKDIVHGLKTAADIEAATAKINELQSNFAGKCKTLILDAYIFALENLVSLTGKQRGSVQGGQPRSTSWCYEWYVVLDHILV
jgi:hypothetical protein